MPESRSQGYERLTPSMAPGSPQSLPGRRAYSVSCRYFLIKKHQAPGNRTRPRRGCWHDQGTPRCAGRTASDALGSFLNHTKGSFGGLGAQAREAFRTKPSWILPCSPLNAASGQQKPGGAGFGKSDGGRPPLPDRQRRVEQRHEEARLVTSAVTLRPVTGWPSASRHR
jgi:hypothetical protein